MWTPDSQICVNDTFTCKPEDAVTSDPHTRRGVMSGEAVLRRKPMGCRWSINSKGQVEIRCLINREHQLAACIQHGCCLLIGSQGTVWPRELDNDNCLWAMCSLKPVKAINGVKLLLCVVSCLYPVLREEPPNVSFSSKVGILPTTLISQACGEDQVQKCVRKHFLQGNEKL